MTLRIIFMGTPEFSIPTLAKILEQGHEVVAVYTQPPRKAGRGGKVRKTPVHTFADEQGLPVFTPKSLKKQELQEDFKALKADVAVVIAYGLLLPKPILEACPHGCLNVHGSLLPRWRGAAPIQRAIMAGDKKTGVMIMQMDEGLDTGDILLTNEILISDTMTAGDLHDEMMDKGAHLLGQALDELEQGTLTATPQSEKGVTYASKISKAETRINWSNTAQDIHNHIRGLSPFPGAWFEGQTAPNKVERIKVLRSQIVPLSPDHKKFSEQSIIINCEKGAIEFIKLQREGKKAVTAKDFINGLKGEFKINT